MLDILGIAIEIVHFLYSKLTKASVVIHHLDLSHNNKEVRQIQSYHTANMHI